MQRIDYTGVGQGDVEISFKVGEEMIETRLCQYFLAVARERNITRAAEGLYITQATLSRQMMDLEKRLGKKLFERSKQLTLTEDGLYFQRQAQAIVDLVRQTEEVFQSQDTHIAGEVRLACAETLAMEEISRIMGVVQQTYPDIRFRIFSGDEADFQQKLFHGELDAAILFDPAVYPQYVYRELPWQDGFGLLMQADAPLAAKDCVMMEDMLQVPLILPNQLLSSAQQTTWFGQHSDAFHVVATYSLLYNSLFLAEQGAGYIFCLGRLAESFSRAGLTFRPFQPALTARLSLVTKKYQAFSPAANAFFKVLQEIISE